VLPVPPGTVIRDLDTREVLGEVIAAGDEILVARGGRGGRGNARFASSTNRAPRRTEPGEPGEERRLRLQLKLLADVGLVGFPNAGKSTMIARISAARPKIADYPFTTLHPNLGVVREAGVDFVLADIPGLIEGANEGAGLGTRFLGHVERCRVLLHLVDATSEDVAGAYRTIRAELKAYDAGLAAKKEIVALSKCDALDEATIAAKATELKAVARKKPLVLSAVSGQGVKEVLTALAREIGKSRAAEQSAAAGEQPKAWQP
jgi:GTP-binding protein